MTVTFIDPIANGAYFGPIPARPYGFTNLLNGVNGVYIYGVKLTIEEQGEKFVPLYVGTSFNKKRGLRGRLITHYTSLKSGGNSLKELYDLSNIITINDIVNLYGHMLLYNGFANNNPLNAARLAIPSLIWFNNAAFFNIKLGLQPPITSTYIPNTGQLNSLGANGDLQLIGTQAALNLEAEIIATKQIFTANFHFIYATLANIEQQVDLTYPNLPIVNRRGANVLARVEFATKIALQQVGINTTANAIAGNLPMNIDLTGINNCIQNDLINVGGHNFGNPYNMPLIIPVP